MFSLFFIKQVAVIWLAEKVVSKWRWLVILYLFSFTIYCFSVIVAIVIIGQDRTYVLNKNDVYPKRVIIIFIRFWFLHYIIFHTWPLTTHLCQRHKYLIGKVYQIKEEINKQRVASRYHIFVFKVDWDIFFLCLK